MLTKILKLGGISTGATIAAVVIYNVLDDVAADIMRTEGAKADEPVGIGPFIVKTFFSGETRVPTNQPDDQEQTVEPETEVSTD